MKPLKTHTPKKAAVLKFIYIAVIVAFVASCKDDDEPSKTDLLTSGSWKLKTLVRNNAPASFTGSLTLLFEKNGDYTETQVGTSGSTYTYTGTWKLINGETDIKIDYAPNSAYSSWSLSINQLTLEELNVTSESDLTYQFKH